MIQFTRACIAVISLICTLLTTSVQVSSAKTVTNVSLTVSPNPLLCIINIVVYPEKRIPRTGNWGTNLTLYLYKNNTKLASASARSNSQGEATFNFCENGQKGFEPGNYNFAIKGLSHLCQHFTGIRAFDSDDQVSNLTLNNQVLFAGETSNIFDDKINSLDASTQIRAFYSTNDEKNDLNRDYKVNSLDFSNTVYNFYDLGDRLCL